MGIALISLIKLIIKDARIDRILLAFLSLSLLGLESVSTLVVFLSVFGVTYGGLRWAPSSFSRLFVCGLSFLQLLPLLFYKYAPFAVSQVTGDLPDVLSDLAIPVGLSFYTFQMVGLVVDTLKGRQPLPSFLNCLNFASFFPQIVAGPIERRSDLLPQMESFRFRLNWVDVELGVRWVVLGLFMKLTLGDNLAAESGHVVFDAKNPFLVWLECVFFSLRVYYDFCGYSLVAYGLARMLGIRLMLNFRNPYWTTNFRDFWRNWHISLSQWFRDYLYIPLGGNRGRFRVFLLFLVFGVSGVWHGAGWNFIFWGLLHGAFLLLPKWTSLKVPKPLAWGIHMILVTFSWLFFLEQDVALLLQKLGSLFDVTSYHMGHLKGVVTAFPSKSALLASLVIFALSALSLILEGCRLQVPYDLLTRRVSCLVMIVMIFLFQPNGSHEFIYFNF